MYRMGIMIVLLIAVITLSVGGTVFQLKRGEANALVINVAGRQRMLSQKMSKYAFMVENGNTDVVDKLKSAENLFDTSLHGLIDGSEALGLPPASPEATQSLQVVEDVWHPFKEALDVVLTADSNSPEFEAAIDHIVAHNEELLTKANDAVTILQEEADAQVRQLLLFLYGLAVAGLIISAATIFGIRNTLAPFVKVTQLANQVTQEDLPAFKDLILAIARNDYTQSYTVKTQPTDFRSDDEVGQLAHAINRLIMRLHEMSDAIKEMSAHLIAGNRVMLNNVAQMGKDALEFSEISVSSGAAMQNITDTIERITANTRSQSNGAEQIVDTLNQLTRAIDGVAQGAQEQAKAAAASAEVAHQITSAIQQVSESAQEGAAQAVKMAEIAQSGVSTVEGVINGIKGIQNASQLQGRKIEEAGTRSEQIGAIVETIGDIAAQTNLLALNAAIEAARAGEHGKGFAVVADEVRKLAEKSAEATEEITELVHGIQASVGEAKEAREQMDTAVTDGIQGANQAGEALYTILDAVQAVAEQVENIAAAAQEVDASADELVSSVESVSAIVEENTASTEEMAASSAEVIDAITAIADSVRDENEAMQRLNENVQVVNHEVQKITTAAQVLGDMANELSEVVIEFKMTDREDSIKQFELFKLAHRRWVNRLDALFAGNITLDENNLTAHTACTLGRWYYGRGKDAFGSVPEFIALEDPHTKVHQYAHQAVEAFNHGNTTTAKEAYNAVKRYVEESLAALERLEDRIL